MKDILGNEIILPSGDGKKVKSFELFKEHIFKKPSEKRFEYATESINILQNADEVWNNPKQGIVYIKYYENAILKVAVNNNEAITIFKLFEKDSGELDSARKGILLYK